MTVESTRRRPGRPARIDRAGIVRAAAELAAEHGAEHVTMTSVAERLGVAMPALYYHVNSRDELLGLVGVSVLERIEVPDVADWDEWLLAFARALRAAALTDPGLVNTAPMTAHGLVNVPLVEGALQRLVRAGFSPNDALLAFDDVVATTVDSVRRDYCLQLEAANGNTQLSLFREALEDFSRDEAPLMWELADEFAHAPDTTSVDRDAWFERHMHVLVAGLRAALEGRATLPGLRADCPG
ncbi:MAG TPA: helix-turn-helix domain-containing protein [Acidimicrobiia bacterium]|jgi:AcrR family transcriptional regulator